MKAYAIQHCTCGHTWRPRVPYPKKCPRCTKRRPPSLGKVLPKSESKPLVLTEGKREEFIKAVRAVILSGHVDYTEEEILPGMKTTVIRIP